MAYVFGLDLHAVPLIAQVAAARNAATCSWTYAAPGWLGVGPNKKKQNPKHTEL